MSIARHLGDRIKSIAASVIWPRFGRQMTLFSAGLIPYTERTIGTVASGKATGATRRQIAEMGIDLNLIPKSP